MINDDEKYLIRTVLTDLRYLYNEWDQKIDDDSLRRSSTVLRNMLVQNAFGNAWRLLGLEKQPKISAPNLKEHIGDISFNKITFASAGGAKHNGMELRGAFMVNFAMSDEQIKARFQRGPHALISTFWLSDFLESPCLIIKGITVNRRELIQYVSNKLGGAHIDTTRDPSDELDKKLILLDEFGKTFKLADKNAIYFELLSVGQSLAKSEDVEKFIAKANPLCEEI